MAAEHFQKGQTIFQEGDKSHDAYFIVSGRVAISIGTTRGRQLLAELGSGEIFGEMGMIMDRPRSATAKAIENTLVERIAEHDFENYFMQNSERLHTYLATLFERIRKTDLLLQEAETAVIKPRAVDVITDTFEQTNTEETEATVYRLQLRSCYDKTGFDHPRVDREITKLPFRIGRSYFDTAVSAFARNDLSLSDTAPYQCSRNHCEIAFEKGRFVLRDRGSKLGSWVGDQHVSVDSGHLTAELPMGDTIIIFGSEHSPHRYLLNIKRI
jgi:CRP-like cAMP-binding protein